MKIKFDWDEAYPVFSEDGLRGRMEVELTEQEVNSWRRCEKEFWLWQNRFFALMRENRNGSIS